MTHGEDAGERSELIKGRYAVLETLGEGGEAQVVKALDRQHDRFVALKIRRVRDDRAAEELLGEARILLAVPPHPALPLVREDFFDGDNYIVAMDWVDGTDLATLLRDRGRPGLAPSSVLAYLAQAAEALTHLHSQDPPVIHGDVKPGNLILTKGGRVKLVDFGLSSAPQALRRRTGTPGYRAPELAADGAASRASDVYALAATAFALLSGKAPAGVLPSWQGVDPAQAEQLEAAIRLGMATDPERRPATPGELIERLRTGWSEALPTGVITLCLSDIEGSTAMWDSNPAAMAAALVRHDELIVDCVESHGGRLIKSMGEGDSTVSVFDSATAALDAAISAARALSAERWPADLRIVARFGIHTGEAERRGSDYFGPAVNLAARLRGQADGGQIFLSEVTTGLVADHLPSEFKLVDMGPHRLKGLSARERIHALKGPGVSAPRPGTECPYRGLLAFEPEDREVFFGREDVAQELIERLAPGRLLAVVGASGSGKSSVLRAGVVASVRAGEVPPLTAASIVTPGQAPTLGVPDDAGHLVVVDQFEELFTLCSDAAIQRAFIADLLAHRGPVAIGVRADLYGRLSEHAELARAVADNQMLLGAMSDVGLGRAVTEPARLAGLRLEPGLVDVVLRDVAGEPGALPLLSHALSATWERRDGRTLTVEGYRESGGVASAIAQTADSVLSSLPAAQRQLTRSMFLRLTELGEGTQASRRRVATDELVPEGVSTATVEVVLQRLADARLVTLGEGTAEVAHEVLIREWPTLRGWLDEDRVGIRLHRQLGDVTRLWDAGGREASDLYRGTRLDASVEWAAAHVDALNASERQFLDASVAEASREQRAQLRANRRLRGLLVGAAILLVVAVVAGVLSLVQRDHARHAESIAKAQALRSDAERIGAQALSDPNLDRSLLLAVAGVRLQDRVETRGDLLAVLQKSPAAIRLLRPSHSEIVALQVSPDESTLAAGDTAGVVRFIDLHSWKQSAPQVSLSAPVLPGALRFSPDGRTVVVGTGQAARSELQAIDVASGRSRLVRSWPGLVPLPPAGSTAVAYSPDGRRLAVAQAIGSPQSLTPVAERLLMLDAASGRAIWQRRYPLRPGQWEFYVAFMPGGRELLTSAQQGDTILWDPATGRMLRRFAVGGLPALSADGRHVALALNSPSPAIPTSSLAILDLRTGQHRSLPSALPAAWVLSLAYAPDGTKIVGGAFDGAHVWDVATGAIAESYVGQPGSRGQMTLDPSGRLVLSGSVDGSVVAWDLGGADRLGRAFRWNTPDQSCPTAPCAAVNRQSTVMATDQGDGTTAIVDLRTLRKTRTLPALTGPAANAVGFLPNGRTLLTGGVNGVARLWDVSSGKLVRTLRFGAPIWWSSISPDGRLVAVQTQAANSPDSRVTVAELATGKVVQTHTVRYGHGGVEFSHDGRELVALGCCEPSSTVVGWDVRAGAQLFTRTIAIHATAIALTPDSRILGVGTEDGQVQFWRARTGMTAEPPIRAAAGGVSQIAFAPNERTFAIASLDQTATLWDLRSRKRVGNPFPTSPGEIPVVVFEPNGRLLIPELANATEWPIDTASWVRFACTTAGRDILRSEWTDLLPDRAYRPVCHA